MFVKQFVDESLGSASCLTAAEESGVVAVIDPQRDVDKYLQVADGLGFNFTYVFDTLLHADFISGARELAELINLKIGASADAQLRFDHARGGVVIRIWS